MRVIRAFLPGGLVLLLAACGANGGSAPAQAQAQAQAQAKPAPASRDQVLLAERAFASSMARRDFDAFRRYVDEEAVFFGGQDTLRGRKAVLAAWQRYFTEVQAPFSWEPDQVELLVSGTLALSTGPVRDAAGKSVARFNSIWRRNARGEWKVIFDKGSPLESAGDAAAGGR